MDGYGLAKIILIGEHSVVYGHPAIAIPFYALRSEVILTPHDHYAFETKYYNGPVTGASEELRGLKALVEKMVELYTSVTPVTIAIRSNLPEKSGLGSSASVAKAVIDAFNHHFHLGLSKDDYFTLLKISENIYHQKASGIDASTIVYEKPIVYQNPHMTTIKINMDGYLVAFYSNTNSATRDAVIHVSNHPHRDIHINGLGAITANAKWALEHNDIELLGAMFNASHSHLKALGISTPALEDLRDQIHYTGAVGVKITGGGMGGCLIALYRDEKTALNARLTLEKYPSWVINLREV